MIQQGHHLFVYGTLKRGQRHHDLLSGQQFIGEAATEPCFRLHDCGPYPCLVEVTENGSAIRGEVYLVDAATLDRLDTLEDVPHLYERRTIRLPGFSAPVAVYLYRQDTTGFPVCDDYWPPIL